MNILFVNACVRGDESNTRKLCRVALEELLQKYPDATVTEVNLDAERPMPLYPEDVKRRSALHAAEDYSDPIFDYAHAFASADIILIGAPYWDLSFPASLKIYLERVCAVEVTFAYTPEGTPYSLCKGQRLLYITTSGAFVEGWNFGYDYIKALNDMFFRLPEIRCFDVGGFDLGGDQNAIVAEGEEKLRAMMRSW